GDDPSARGFIGGTGTNFLVPLAPRRHGTRDDGGDERALDHLAFDAHDIHAEAKMAGEFAPGAFLLESPAVRLLHVVRADQTMTRLVIGRGEGLLVLHDECAEILLDGEGFWHSFDGDGHTCTSW